MMVFGEVARESEVKVFEEGQFRSVTRCAYAADGHLLGISVFEVINDPRKPMSPKHRHLQEPRSRRG